MDGGEESRFLASVLPIDFGEVQSTSLLAGGRNNRVLRLETNRGLFVVKRFFPTAKGARNRFESEQYFLDTVASQAKVFLPKRLFSSREHELMVSEFVSGLPITDGDSVTKAHIDACVQFLYCINHPDIRSRYTLEAAEAAFSLEEHIRFVDQRFSRFANIDLPEDIEILIAEVLSPKWLATKRELLKSKLPSLDRAQAIISPSDFGFHNMLMRSAKEFVFFDFEYAGLDDSGKTGSDFLLQPRILVSIEILLPLLEALEEIEPGAKERVKVLLPLFAVKWCCIFLNEFLPRESDRRIFSQGESLPEGRREEQITKVKELLARMNVLLDALTSV